MPGRGNGLGGAFTFYKKAMGLTIYFGKITRILTTIISRSLQSVIFSLHQKL
jgi:hypothetical protein